MKSLSISLVVLALSTATVMCTGAQAQKDPAKDSSTRSYKIEVSGTKGWVDTDIDVRGGAKLRFTEDQYGTEPSCTHADARRFMHSLLDIVMCARVIFRFSQLFYSRSIWFMAVTRWPPQSPPACSSSARAFFSACLAASISAGTSRCGEAENILAVGERTIIAQD